MSKFEILVDEENNAEEFWDAARDHGGGSFAEPIESLVAKGRLVVDAEQRDQLLSHFRRLPGWATGPDHARNPVVVNEIAE